MKILILGEIIGKIGRQAVVKTLPNLKKEIRPDLVLANAENLAHGKGVTLKTIKEILVAGIDFLTSGDHFWSKKEEIERILPLDLSIIRPANYPANLAGEGYKVINVKSQSSNVKPCLVLIINLTGRVFMKEKEISCPFKKFDEIISKIEKRPKVILVDFHAEATAEKIAFAHYVDGRASVVFGTHTHVVTADERILSKGTAFITDLGMIGAKNSVIGFRVEEAIKRNIEDEEIPLEVPEKGWAIGNGIFVEINEKTGRAEKIERIKKEVEIK